MNIILLFKDGEINLGFDDEIIMSLEDSMDQKSQM